MSKSKEARQRVEAEKIDSRLRLLAHNAAEAEKPKYKSIDEMLYECVFRQYHIGGLGEFRGMSKNEFRRSLELARHLFGKYKVPKILNDVWFPEELDHHRMTLSRNRDLRVAANRVRIVGEDRAFRHWYITIGTGGSFYKEHAKDFLTRKEAHTFLECAHDISITAALKYAIAICAGAEQGKALRVARCKICFEQIKTDRWRDVIRFFSRETPDSVEEANDIVDWVSYKFNNDPSFRISGHGYTIESIRKKVKDWHYELRRIKAMGDHHWDGHAIPNFNYEVKSNHNRGMMDIWTITQILNTKELAAEGTAQHHCVYSYRVRCQTGDCSIWSVKFNGNRKLTMELLNDGRLVQIRGYANRLATNEELNVVNRWCAINGLTRGSRW